MPSNSGAPDDDMHYSRRNWLKLTATGAAGLSAGLAGCSGGSSDPSGDGGDGSGGGDGGGDGGNGGDGSDGSDGSDGGTTEELQMVDRSFVSVTRNVPTDIQFNVFNPQIRPFFGEMALYDKFTEYNAVTGEYVPVLATDWSFGSDKVTLTLSDEHTWHNGDPIRAKDFETAGRINALLNAGGSSNEEGVVDEVNAAGEKTLEWTLNTSEYNTAQLKEQLLVTPLRVKHEVYKPFLDKLEAAEEEGEDELKAAQKEVIQTKFAPDKIVANGPFKFERRSQQRYVLSKYEDYPTADTINFPRMEFRYISGDDQRIQAMRSNRIDGLNIVPQTQNIVDSMPDNWQVKLIPGTIGGGIIFQHHRDITGRMNVKKAVSYLVEPKQAMIAANGFNKSQVSVPTFAPEQVNNLYLDDPENTYEMYQVDENKAAQLLRSEGFSKSGGKWRKPNGEVWEPSIKYPAGWSAWISMAQTIASQLQDAGIQAQAVGRENSVYFSKVLKQGNFDMGLLFWGAPRNHPYYHYRRAFDSWYSKVRLKYPQEGVKAPPMGQPDGSMQSVNPADLLAKLSKTKEKEASKGIVQELAWIANQTLPAYPLFQKQTPAWYTTDEWDFPEKDAPEMSVRYPWEYLLRVGKFHAKA